jgi:hypothetical protein
VEVAAAEQEVVELLAEDVEVVQRVVRRPLLYVISSHSRGSAGSNKS